MFNLNKDTTCCHTISFSVSLNLSSWIPSDLVIKAHHSVVIIKGRIPYEQLLTVYCSAMYTRYLCQQSIEENKPFCILLAMKMIYSCCISCSWHVSEFLFAHLFVVTRIYIFKLKSLFTLLCTLPLFATSGQRKSKKKKSSPPPLLY